MKLSELNNGILIIEDNAKMSILEKFNSEKKLLNIKLITLSEFKNKYFFEYDNRALAYIIKTYNVIYEVAEVYLKNLYFVNKAVDEKTKHLLEIKSKLLSKGYIKENDLFKKYLIGKKIYLYNLKYVDDFYRNVFKELEAFSEVFWIEDDHEETKKKLYVANNKDEEVSFVANEICNLIKKGVNIDKIKLANVQENYVFALWRTFKFFGIPLELPVYETIGSTNIVKKFEELYNSDMDKTFLELKEFVKTKRDERIYKKLIDVVNSYNWCDDYLDVKYLIFKEINSIKHFKKKFKNAVKLIDFPKEIVKDDEYVFLINFNQGVIPKEYKDEDYLNDKTKEILGVSASYLKNENNLLEVKEAILKTKNLILTYSNHDLSNELYVSNAYDESICESMSVYDSFENSDKYNLIKLLCAKDENKKYGTVTNELLILNNHYKDAKYSVFANSFKGLDLNKLFNYMGNKLTLSYSSMNTFYQCGFRYYLQNVLNLDKYEDTFQTVIGNIFHKILSECFIKNDYDVDSAYENEIQNSEYKFDEMEMFFIHNLKDELIMIIDVIKAQMENTSLKNALYEQEIIIDIDKSRSVRFKGFIDKILYGENNGQMIVAIIDYKTGNPDLCLNNAIYGLDMQLPIYVYLIKNSNRIQNVNIGGFYLQKILSSVGNAEKRRESLKLQGYSNSDLNILEAVDKTYKDSQNIKSLRMSSNGFYAYAKVLNNKSIDKLADIVENKVQEASNDILKGKFDINPKEIGNKLLGCKFCKFKDICYMNNSDVIKLKEIKSSEFLGGDLYD